MRLFTAFLAASLGLGSLASGCSETTPAPPLDASAVDAPDVPSLDAPDAPDVPTIDVAADRAMDLGSDRGPADAPIADVPRDAVDAGRCDPATGCHAFWCGCGRCNPSEITCTPDVRGCPLGCLSACPELDTAVCACSGDTCGAPVLRADAGTDAGTDAGADAGADGGGLAAGQLCGSDGECATGLLCCYPCGIPGCMNRCGSPDPRTGRCPLLL
jgi:hypothetical protein